jgi:KDO2-lipid IV(A) lauroyltransferase
VASARRSQGSEGAALAEPAWPVPHQEVRGDRSGVAAELECLAVRALLAAAGRLPRRVQAGLTYGLARAAAALDRRHSDAARRFLEQAYGGALEPERREELVRAAWRTLFDSVLESEHIDRRLLARPDVLARCELDLGELPRVLAEKRGGLVATCHLGAWEVLAALAPRLGVSPFYVVSRPPRNRPLSAVFQAQREARGYRLIPRHGALSSIPKIVAAGGYVALLVDQRARGRTVLAPFFGRQAHCERSVAILARRLGVPLIVGASTRLPGERFAVRVPRVFWPEELARRSPEEVLAAINAEFERMILAQPDQYLWLHDRYRKAPPAEPSGAPSRGAEPFKGGAR